MRGLWLCKRRMKLRFCKLSLHEIGDRFFSSPPPPPPFALSLAQHTRTHARAHTHTHARTHTRTITHIHTHTHTHTQARAHAYSICNESTSVYSSVIQATRRDTKDAVIKPILIWSSNESPQTSKPITAFVLQMSPSRQSCRLSIASAAHEYSWARPAGMTIRRFIKPLVLCVICSRTSLPDCSIDRNLGKGQHRPSPTHPRPPPTHTPPRAEKLNSHFFFALWQRRPFD